MQSREDFKWLSKVTRQFRMLSLVIAEEISPSVSTMNEKQKQAN